MNASFAKILKKMGSDERGFVVSIEVVLIAIVALIGLIAGLSATRDALVSELSDVAGSMQDINQSYTINGTVGHSSVTGGLDFIDQTDHCDDNDDVSGATDNCVVFSVPPSNPVGNDDLVVQFDFDAGVTDGSPGGANDGTLQNGATVSGGILNLDGIDDFVSISNTGDINLGIHEQRTVMLNFNANDVNTRQVLYEEGAASRGLVIYIENGLLYIGGWNIPESGWLPSYVSTPITAGIWNTATLVLDGTDTVQPNSLTGYLNGSAFGSTDGSQLWQHGGAVGVGGSNGTGTLFAPGGVQDPGVHSFNGQIDSFGIFNRPVTDAEIEAAGGGYWMDPIISSD